MANELDSGHVILPVLHPDGEVHNIAVPPDTDLGAFHAALLDVATAKKWNHPVYVVSRNGLSMIRPSDGAIVQVYQSPNWMTEKTPK